MYKGTMLDVLRVDAGLLKQNRQVVGQALSRAGRGTAGRGVSCFVKKKENNPALEFSQKRVHWRRLDGRDPDDWWGVVFEEASLPCSSAERRDAASSRSSCSSNTNRFDIKGNSGVSMGKGEAEKQSHWSPPGRHRSGMEQIYEEGHACHGESDEDLWFGASEKHQNFDGSTNNSNGTSKRSSRHYYYHEYHYLRYYRAKMETQKWKEEQRSLNGGWSGEDILTPVEKASVSIRKAVDIASLDKTLHQKSNTPNSARYPTIEECEETILAHIQEAASHCGFDVVAFAMALGLRVDKDMGKEAMKKRARKSIVLTFHPDKLAHIRHSQGQHLPYILGQTIIKVMSTMPR